VASAFYRLPQKSKTFTTEDTELHGGTPQRTDAAGIGCARRRFV